MASGFSAKKQSTVLLRLETVDLQNVGASRVQEVGVVRDHDAGHVLERVDVVDDPLDVQNVQVVGGFILN